MKYFAQIQAFFNKKMTGVDREAFEHEAMDNLDLATELDAYQTGADLFDFAAGNLSDDQILGFEKQNAPSETGSGGHKFYYSVVGIFLIVVVGLLLFDILGSDDQNLQKKAPTQPVEEKEQPAQERPIAEAPSQQLLLTSGESDQLSAKVETKEASTVPVPPTQSTTSIKPSAKPQTSLSEDMASLETKREKANDENSSSSSTELTSDALIASGEKIVYQAGEQIRLTPGFHAEAGSSFKASVVKID